MVMTLSGVMVALVTPLNESGEVDATGLERVVGRAVAAGVSGVCPVGSTGEGTRLTESQRATVVRVARSVSPAHVMLIPSPSAVVPAGIAREIEVFAELGADAVLVASPPGYALSAGAVRDFYLDLADRSALPVVMYNFPTLTNVTVPPTVVGELARHERVVGIKDSSRDLETFQAILYATADVPGFATLTGSDSMLMASLLIGGSGAIAASANLVPQLGVELHGATLAGDLPLARELQQRLFAIVSAARQAGFPYGWKAALQLCGLCSARPAFPATAPNMEALERLRQQLTDLGVL